MTENRDGEPCPECGNISELMNQYEADNDVGQYIVKEYFCARCPRSFATNEIARKSSGGEYFRK